MKTKTTHPILEQDKQHNPQPDETPLTDARRKAAIFASIELKNISGKTGNTKLHNK